MSNKPNEAFVSGGEPKKVLDVPLTPAGGESLKKAEPAKEDVDPDAGDEAPAPVKAAPAAVAPAPARLLPQAMGRLAMDGRAFRSHRPTQTEVALCAADVAAYLFAEGIGAWPADLRTQAFQEGEVEWGLLVEVNGVEV